MTSATDLQKVLNVALDDLTTVQEQLTEARVAERTAHFYWLCRTTLLKNERHGRVADVIDLSGGWTLISWLRDPKSLELYSTIDSARSALSLEGEFVFVLDDISPRTANPSIRVPRTDEPFTHSQRAILRDLRKGLTNGEIGAHLGLAESTIKNAVTRIYRKLGPNVQGRIQAALMVKDWNLDDDEVPDS